MGPLVTKNITCFYDLYFYATFSTREWVGMEWIGMEWNGMNEGMINPFLCLETATEWNGINMICQKYP